jgi:hypothetical protein
MKPPPLSPSLKNVLGVWGKAGGERPLYPPNPSLTKGGEKL